MCALRQHANVWIFDTILSKAISSRSSSWDVAASPHPWRLALPPCPSSFPTARCVESCLLHESLVYEDSWCWCQDGSTHRDQSGHEHRTVRWLGHQLIHGAREIYSSTSYATEENEGLETIVSEMRRLSSKLLPPGHFQGSEDERALCRLAVECNTLSDRIVDLLEKSSPRGPPGLSTEALGLLWGICCPKERSRNWREDWRVVAANLSCNWPF